MDAGLAEADDRVRTAGDDPRRVEALIRQPAALRAAGRGTHSPTSSGSDGSCSQQRKLQANRSRNERWRQRQRQANDRDAGPGREEPLCAGALATPVWVIPPFIDRYARRPRDIHEQRARAGTPCGAHKEGWAA